MPTASSSAMCLSRATGSRPVQPAMTAWSIDMVSGVAAPLSITVKVRSYTDRALHRGSEFKDAAIGAAGGSQHEADRHFVFTMRGQRDRTAIDHVDEGAVAQATQILGGEGLVIFSEIGNARRRVRRSRHDQRVIGRKAARDPRNQRAARIEDVDVVGRADGFATHDANGNAGV